jgi:hypothetical protein
MAARVKSKAKAKAVPAILPREQLTKKAKRAIVAFVEHKTKNFPHLYYAIDQTLKAERMHRSKLYEWLESKGYRWDSRVGLWIGSDDKP